MFNLRGSRVFSDTARRSPAGPTETLSRPVTCSLCAQIRHRLPTGVTTVTFILRKINRKLHP